MAGVLKTSKSNIFRFAKSIGYKGYPDLQNELQNKIKQKISLVKVLKNTKEREKGTNIYSTIFEIDGQNLKETKEANSFEKIDRVVQAIIGARRVGFVGFRSSRAIAYLLFFYVGRVRKKCELLDSTLGNLTHQLINYGPKDLLVGVSFPRYGHQTVEILKYGKKIGCQIISITDNPISPAGQISDIVLIAGNRSLTYFNSFTSAVALVNCLVAGVSLKNRQSLKILKTFDEIDQEWDYFYAASPGAIVKPKSSF